MPKNDGNAEDFDPVRCHLHTNSQPNELTSLPFSMASQNNRVNERKSSLSINDWTDEGSVIIYVSRHNFTGSYGQPCVVYLLLSNTSDTAQSLSVCWETLQ